VKEPCGQVPDANGVHEVVPREFEGRVEKIPAPGFLRNFFPRLHSGPG
jgi:hypothetical protein